MKFKDRHEAGIQLALRLMNNKTLRPLILALPRGGVPVGYEIATALRSPFDVLTVKKLSHPDYPEVALGAIAPHNTYVYNQALLDHFQVTETELSQIVIREKEEMNRREILYRNHKPFPELFGKTIIVTDDGAATGFTMTAAMELLLKYEPHQIIIAIPVCSTEAFEVWNQVLRPQIDTILPLIIPQNFHAVGSWYENFQPVLDEEVISLIKKAAWALAT